MAQFATQAELADRLGLTLTAAEQTRANGLLALASGLVQREARQTVEEVEDDILTLRGNGEATIRLPERPVILVSAVTLDGEALDSDRWYVDGDELVRVGWRIWPSRKEIEITYTHGYDLIPDAIKAVVLEAVVRVWVNPGSVQQEGYGSEQTAYQQQGIPSGLVLTDDECRTVRRALGRGSGSLALR